MTPSSLRGRYAPSPSGALHLGNLRTALLAWLSSRSLGGSFALRIEDLDLPRTRPGAAAALLADLRWLGLDWDDGPDVGGPYGPYYQSQRTALYDAAFAGLRARDLIYPCYCTRAELARVGGAPHAGEEGLAYPGTCRDLSDAQRRRRDHEGRRRAWRLRVPDGEIAFYDALTGDKREKLVTTCGDFIVRRGDGLYAYQLAVVVDDALMGVTQVVRGADLLGSTARQLALYDTLGYPRPRNYAHVPMLRDATGVRLSKREAASGLDPLRARGMQPAQVVGWLAASCGLTPNATPIAARDLAATFDASAIREIGTLAAL
ncbi:MAG: tRNA glutamyl-Q(34) synthetase GluQRS [Ktedonobacterales bacterium]